MSNQISITEALETLKIVEQRIAEIREAYEGGKAEPSIEGWNPGDDFKEFHEATIGDADLTMKMLGIAMAMGSPVKASEPNPLITKGSIGRLCVAYSYAATPSWKIPSKDPKGRAWMEFYMGHQGGLDLHAAECTESGRGSKEVMLSMPRKHALALAELILSHESNA